MTHPDDQTIFNKVLKFWPLILAALMAAVTWGATKQKLSGLVDIVNVTDTTVKLHETRLTVMEQIAKEQHDQLKEVRSDIKELLRRVR